MLSPPSLHALEMLLFFHPGCFKAEGGIKCGTNTTGDVSAEADRQTESVGENQNQEKLQKIFPGPLPNRGAGGGGSIWTQATANPLELMKTIYWEQNENAICNPALLAEQLFALLCKQGGEGLRNRGGEGHGWTPCLRSAGDGKTAEQPLVLVVPTDFRVSSRPILQEQVLFEGKKVTVGLEDAQGIPGGKSQQMVLKDGAKAGCSWVSPPIRDLEPDTLCLRETHRGNPHNIS